MNQPSIQKYPHLFAPYDYDDDVIMILLTICLDILKKMFRKNLGIRK